MEKFKEVELPTHAQLAEIISLRDYMAMTALGAIVHDRYAKTELDHWYALHSGFAQEAYKLADEMLEARKINED